MSWFNFTPGIYQFFVSLVYGNNESENNTNENTELYSRVNRTTTYTAPRLPIFQPNFAQMQFSFLYLQERSQDLKKGGGGGGHTVSPPGYFSDCHVDFHAMIY